MTTDLNTHATRNHSGKFALELLADPSSKELDHAAVRALFQIGWRDCAEANSGEWAFLHLVELAVTLRHRKEEVQLLPNRPVGVA